MPASLPSLPLVVRVGGHDFPLPAQAPAAWWQAVRAHAAIATSRDPDRMRRERDARLLEALRVERPGLALLPVRAGWLYEVLAGVYGEQRG